MNTEQRVIEKLNRELGSDVKNLHKSEYLIKRFQNDLQDIQNMLTVTSEDCDPTIKNTLETCSSKSDEIDVALAKIGSFEATIEAKIEINRRILEKVDHNLEQIRNLEHLKEYLELLRDIQNISSELTLCVNGKDENKTIGLYVALSGSLSNSIIDRLVGVDAPHLKIFARQTAFYWHDILKDKFSKEFEAVLKVIKWPNLNQTLELFNPSKDNLNKLSTYAEYLFLVKMPGDQNLLNVKLTPSIICPVINLPIELLIKPFKLRFSYHFSGTKQTNRLDKPEWYFTQILSWAKDNHIFVGQNFQSSALKAGMNNLNVRIEFIRGLVQIAIEKIILDIDDICRDETLFAHLVDEILAFEQELKTNLGYPSHLPSAVSVIMQPQYLTKWMAIEEKFTTDKMDAMLKKGDPWEFLDPANMEELKIPRCADQFIRLLDAIKERYCALPQPGQQLQFLELQLELIDNFRRRLVQLHNSPVDNVNSTKILNAINYINSVLREWGENVHYLHLHAALLGPNAEEITSVFDKIIAELEHWQRQLVKQLSSKIVDDIKAKSKKYRHDTWISMHEFDTKEPFMLSPSASEMFQLLVTNLHNLEMDLSLNVFNIVIRLIAQQLDEFFVDSMVMNTKFSSGGALQFQFDMTRNLFALFGQYARRPNLLFKHVNDACTLLTLPLGSAMLLYDTLNKETNVEAITSTLKEMSITALNNILALDILERRTDICS